MGKDDISRNKQRKKDQYFTKNPSKNKLARQSFSDESYSSSASSCFSWDLCDSRSKRSRKKVKSGARVKKRPVVKTELWPHTISNEEDGEEVDSETIGLAKFMSCFTYIMMECRSVESRGRAALLHAVSTVLVYLPWPEARTFHNIMMVKIEQDRINWLADFTALANNYVDKKVRLSLKEKSLSVGSNYRSPLISAGDDNDSQRNFGDKDRSVHKFICWQWNYSSCSFGENCKRWHACRACAEAGRLGESHKASSHENTSFRAKPGEWRV